MRQKAVSCAYRQISLLNAMIYLCFQSIQAPSKAPGSTANTRISQMKHSFCPIHTCLQEIRGNTLLQQTAPELDNTFVVLCRILPSIIFDHTHNMSRLLQRIACMCWNPQAYLLELIGALPRKYVNRRHLRFCYYSLYFKEKRGINRIETELAI